MKNNLRSLIMLVAICGVAILPVTGQTKKMYYDVIATEKNARKPWKGYLVNVTDTTIAVAPKRAFFHQDSLNNLKVFKYEQFDRLVVKRSRAVEKVGFVGLVLGFVGGAIIGYTDYNRSENYLIETGPVVNGIAGGSVCALGGALLGAAGASIFNRKLVVTPDPQTLSRFKRAMLQ